MTTDHNPADAPAVPTFTRINTEDRQALAADIRAGKVALAYVDGSGFIGSLEHEPAALARVMLDAAMPDPEVDPFAGTQLSAESLRFALKRSAYVIIAPEGIPEILELMDLGTVARKAIRAAVTEAGDVPA